MTEILASAIGPVLGILGVVVGTILNEYLRRGRRAEEFSSVIFEKRLKAYEKLLSLIDAGSDIAEEVIRNPKLSAEERHDLVSTIVMPIAEHVDRHSLYINEELGAHCTALFMGTEDFFDEPEEKRAESIRGYYEMKKETQRMISEDSGVASINKLFHTIYRPKITSPVIEAIREMRREIRRKK